MNKYIYIILFSILITKIAVAQPLLIKPHFIPGDTLSYIVTEEEKSASLVVLSKAKHHFKVKFIVLDTSQGTTLNFSIQLFEPVNKKFVTQQILDKIRSGINLTYTLNNSGWLIDLKDYGQNQLRAIEALDTIMSSPDLSREQIGVLQLFQRKLRKPDGLELVLEPFLLFNEIYLTPTFRNQKDYHPASTFNIFYQPEIAGTMITELKKPEWQQGTAYVSTGFIANKDSASKVIIPLYNEIFFSLKGRYPKGMPDAAKFETHTEYQIKVVTGYPIYISKKSVTVYDLKNTSSIEMIKVNE